MAVLTFGLAIVSCSDKDVDSGTSGNPDPVDPVNPEKKDTADYTIIYWGMAGKLDIQTSFDLATVAYNYQQGKVGKNVQIAGLLKTSVCKAFPDLSTAGSDMTIYFDSDSIGKKAVSKDDVSVDRLNELQTDQDVVDFIGSNYDAAFEVLGGKKYGDTNYPLNNADSLANFIKATAKKFPAHHYILLPFGHGSGFSPVNDMPVSTKTCVSDDYTGTHIPADVLVSAVQKSGVKIQTLFAHNCLMATVENIAAFSQVFDYALFSAEPIYSFFFPEYLVKLSQAGDDEAKMVKASQDEVDYFVERLEGLVGKDAFTSNGFYDLRKSGTLLAATKEAADWYIENYDNAAYRDSINEAMMRTVISVELEDEYSHNKKVTDTLRDARAELQKLINHDIEDFEADKFEDLMKKALRVASNDNGFGFPFADLMRNTLLKELPEEKTAALKTIYDKYMTALKDMAYIRTTSKPAKAGADYEYIYASPTINIFALNSDYFIPVDDSQLPTVVAAIKAKDWDKLEESVRKMIGGTVFAYDYLEQDYGLSEVTKNYTSSVFDQQVKWSNFLKKLTFNPTVMICPDRKQISEGM